MENNKVSIIICHWKNDLIYRCLKSLENINAQKIVLSSDMNFHYYPNVDIYHLGLNEPAYKRNWGATVIAKGEYLAFLDDDIEVGIHCISRMVNILDQNSDIGMVYATLHKMDKNNPYIIDTSGSFLSWNGFLYETYINRPQELITPILSAKSACCMIRKKLFMQVGRFDQDYVIYGEETDLSWRIWQASYKVVIRNDAIAYHAFETSLKPKSYYNPYYIHYHGCKNYITTLLKNLPPNRLYIALLNALVWFTMGLLMLFKNKKAGKWILQGIWYNVRNFKYIWKKRQETQKTSDHSYWKLIYKNPSLFYYFKRCKDYLTHQLHG